jgi:hypothetical protein
MAKSDLLKQAIADANTVKETALANAKIALQEAFAPRIQSMLSAKLSEELDDEEEVGMDDAAMDAPVDDVAGMEGEEDFGAGEDVGDLSIDVNNDGEFDEFDVFSKADGMGDEEVPAEEEPAMSDEEMADEYNEGMDMEDELNLEEIIRELEEGMYEEEEEDVVEEGAYEAEEEVMEEDIDAIIEAILAEEDDVVDVDVPAGTDVDASDVELKEVKAELEEAYSTVKKLNSIINEVNLLNAKLLYTNKLFRNFELSEGQKMKVIENFDRAGNTREVKLVFSTLAESFKRPEAKKRVVKESYASKAVATTAPKKETTQVLSEGFELANRWKKLAGLL